MSDVLLPDIAWKPKPPATEDELFHYLDRMIARADRANRRRAAHAVRDGGPKGRGVRRSSKSPPAAG
jgi:hypothetical protein